MLLGKTAEKMKNEPFHVWVHSIQGGWWWAGRTGESGRPVHSPTLPLFTGVNSSSYFILSETPFCCLKNGDNNLSLQRTKTRAFNSNFIEGMRGDEINGMERKRNSFSSEAWRICELKERHLKTVPLTPRDFLVEKKAKSPAGLGESRIELGSCGEGYEQPVENKAIHAALCKRSLNT